MTNRLAVRVPSNNNRKTGFSLRQHLIDQGVTTEDALRAHLAFISKVEKMTGNHLPLNRYKVNPNNPNSPILHQG